MDGRVEVSLIDGVAEIGLNRPDKMNALDSAMIDALIETGERLKTLPGLRAVVLSGAGKGFCAGLDLENFARMVGEPGAVEHLLARDFGIANRAQQAVLIWREVPVPVIAAIQDIAFGGGFQLALGADMRFAAPQARFSVMEIKWGLVPDMGGMLLMPRLARGDVIADLSFSGRIFSGREALAYGFATRLCDDPRAEALAAAREIAGKNPHAIRANKRLLQLACEADAAGVLKAETEEQRALIATPNQKEAVQANLEKRAARFGDL